MRRVNGLIPMLGNVCNLGASAGSISNHLLINILINVEMKHSSSYFPFPIIYKQEGCV